MDRERVFSVRAQGSDSAASSSGSSSEQWLPVPACSVCVRQLEHLETVAQSIFSKHYLGRVYHKYVLHTYAQIQLQLRPAGYKSGVKCLAQWYTDSSL